MSSFAAGAAYGEFQSSGDQQLVDRAVRRTHWLLWRFYEEVLCFWRHIVPLVLSMFITIYGTTLLFPNISFYRYGRAYGHQNSTECQTDMLDYTKNLCVPRRLQDLGHDLVPELSGEHGQLVDLPMFFLVGFTSGVTMFVTLFQKKEKNKPYVINVIRRFLVTFALGHILRLFCYMATTVPGAADYCLDAAQIHPPQEANIHGFKLFYDRKSTFGKNCGDLIFSGHLLITVSMLCVLWTYGGRCWGLESRGHTILFCVMLIPALAQTVMILSARHHYSVDVVVAWYTTPLLWNFHNTALMPEDDFVPDHVALARWVLKGDPAAELSPKATPLEQKLSVSDQPFADEVRVPLGE
eukprot:TRINITY_DN4401_c0_g1_i1.p1 TRINITY_DN4401_c0_g1~~TRINITY_DN4401_c0_g1_i1.p1  ORF type:complete len:353 (+),score=74.23 TRINITY_DN4401_c0_g1_i1:101-1159(+)